MPRSTGPRSFWAWGYEDRFPSGEARRRLRDRVTMILGGGVEERPLPTFEEIRLRTPGGKVPTALAAFARDDARERALHTYGRGFPDLVRGFSGDFLAAPDFVLFPRDEDDVTLAMKVCEDEGIALVPFGGGTSVVGGVEHAPDARRRATLDLGLLSGVHEIDRASLAARIGAGMRGPAIDAALGEHGLTLRHFPQSYEHSTLGGWIATRAGGHFATLYTHIDDLVESVRMITPRGPLETRRLPASGAGPSPERFVLGSEGTMGIITEAWMRVRPVPSHRASASVCFPSWDDAVASVRELAQSGLYPTNARLLDAREALIHEVATDGSCVLLLGFESHDHALEPWMSRALAITADRGGVVSSGPTYVAAGARTHEVDRASAEAAWRQAFFDAPYLQSALVAMGLVVDTFETACTWSAFPTLHAAVVRAVKTALKEACGGGLVSCRFTHVYPDGPAPYYTFMGAGRPGEQIRQWSLVKQAACGALIEHGATITHHHAVGRVHREGWHRERPPLFGKVLEAAKRELDPAGILNPGVLL